jgi:thioredoxin reductase (NADPH)
MARFAESVTILVRRPGLSETMSQYLVDEIQDTPNVHVEGSTVVVDGGGDGGLSWIETEHRTTGERRRRDTDALFPLIGASPHTGWLPDEVGVDDRGFVLTGSDVPRAHWVDGVPPTSLATTVHGVFAVGDVRAGSMKRVAAAAGEGASVVPFVHAHVAAEKAG